MSSSFLLKARAAWLFGAGLVVAGLLVLVYAVALLLWQSGVPGSLVPWAMLQLVAPAPAWLTGLPLAIAVALLGVALGSLGVLIARWQSARISAEKRRAQDRLRRVHQYRDAGRVEPFIGPGTDADAEDARRRRIA